jgi:hypothetical protein
MKPGVGVRFLRAFAAGRSPIVGGPGMTGNDGGARRRDMRAGHRGSPVL